MSFRDFLLNEMMTRKMSNNPKYVVAFRGTIWLLDDNSNFEQVAKEIIDQHPLKDDEIEYPQHMEISDIWSLSSWISDYVYDAVAGKIDEKKYLNLFYTTYLNPASSILLKKVVHDLNLRGVIKNDEDKVEKTTKSKMTGQWVKEAYHGTAGKYLFEILRFGLTPNNVLTSDSERKGNYEKVGIVHDDRVFLTGLWSEAASHAFHTANIQHSHPVVLSFKIPDPALLKPDYDIDTMASANSYPNSTKRGSGTFAINSFQASRESALFAYKGRIPANQITGIYVYNYVTSKWEKANKRILQSRYQRLDSDMWHVYYGEEGMEDRYRRY